MDFIIFDGEGLQGDTGDWESALKAANPGGKISKAISLPTLWAESHNAWSLRQEVRYIQYDPRRDQLGTSIKWDFTTAQPKPTPVLLWKITGLVPVQGGSKI